MYCRYCGLNIPEASQFCPHCGRGTNSAFTGQGTVQQNVPGQNAYTKYCHHCGLRLPGSSQFCSGCGKSTVSHTAARSRKLPLILGIASVAVVVMIVAGVCLLKGMRDDPRVSIPDITVPVAETAPATLPAAVPTESAPVDPPAPTAESSPPATEAQESEAPRETQATKPVRIASSSTELPDLSCFLDSRYTQNETGKYTHYVTCIYDKDEGTKPLEEFLALLQEDRYQLELDSISGEYKDSYSTATCKDYFFHYTGKNDSVQWIETTSGDKYHVRVTLYTYKEKDYSAIVLYMHPEFELEDSGVHYGDVEIEEPAKPTQSTQDTADITVEDPNALPDFLSFSGSENYRQDLQYDKYYDYSMVTTTSQSVDDAYVIKDYVDTLVDVYGYEIVDTREDIRKTWGVTQWFLDHPDENVENDDYITSENKKKADVMVKMLEDYDDDYVSVTIQFISDLTYGVQVEPDDPGSGHECYSCNRGDCRTCGGDGEVTKIMIGEGTIVQDCTDIFCNNGSCTVCGGDGWVD